MTFPRNLAPSYDPRVVSPWVASVEPMDIMLRKIRPDDEIAL
jgi:hypothetical protein